MYEKFKSEVIANKLFQPNDNVLIAVSGGIDSMVLLQLMKSLSKALAFEITVIHINHKLRPTSDDEAAFVRAFALEHQIAYLEEAWQHEDIKSKLEERARAFRYSVFSRLMTEFSFNKLVTAHHADDQAETFLMRLIRGNRLFNLASISPKRAFANGELIRPLLAFTKKELQLLDVPHIEDESNLSQDYFRNRVRHQYLPELSAENPKFSVNVRKRVTELNFAKELIEQHLAPVMKLLVSDGRVDLLKFQQLSASERYFFLLKYLENAEIFDLSDGLIQQLLQSLNNAKQYKIRLNNQDMLIKDYLYFYLSSGNKTKLQPKSFQLNVGENLHADDFEIIFEAQEGYQKIPIFPGSVLLIRTRQAKDKLKISENSSKKLRRLFIDEKIPRNERENAKIIEQNGKIVAVLTKNRRYLSKFSETDTIMSDLYFKWKG
ncbi:MAG: tRNA lysidine(34) synthetase TilS [Streptococcaceae bacterium]|nr:tRNA lysidine(34) synthetase TilS [Streptococcaceae bacterium]